MKLKTLLNKIKQKNPKLSWQIKGSKEIELTGISANSKTIAPGNLFIAKKGRTFDGLDFVKEAVLAGAKAVVSDLENPFLQNISQIVHDGKIDVEAKIAAAYHSFPSEKLFAVGVTGTNGKTTVSYLLKHILQINKTNCGIIGTVEYFTGKHYPAKLTTPSACRLQKLLAEMLEHKLKAAVIETSSQALDQNRCSEIDFDLVIFTNLTQDHLDYHQNMQNYFQAKLKLFEHLTSDKTAILNLDDFYAGKILEKTRARKITFAVKQMADLKAENIRLYFDGMKFDLIYKQKTEKGRHARCKIQNTANKYKNRACETQKISENQEIYAEQKVEIFSSLTGMFNVYNILAATAAALQKGIGLEKIAKSIVSFKGVKGRLQRAEIKADFSVFVDYAHTADALAKTLAALQELKQGRLLVVFGCGGNRDQSKRAEMGRVAAEQADLCIITNDNPRQEDPQKIIRQIITGMKKTKIKTSYCIEEDRYLAIKKAIQMAQKNDIILIAGKGHEAYQILKDTTIVFDDKETVEKICQACLV